MLKSVKQHGLKYRRNTLDAIWSNANVREAISAMQQKREANFAPLPPLKGFREFG
jgi:hypothetical protein